MSEELIEFLKKVREGVNRSFEDHDWCFNCEAHSHECDCHSKIEKFLVGN